MVPFVVVDASTSLRFQPVCSADEIDYFLIESAAITGELGREFVIAGADRLTYRISPSARGYEVQRLDINHEPVHTMEMPSSAITDHFIGHAMRSGQLFVAAVACD